MNTINIKRTLACLILGASYLLTNAQGIIVYKTDGTQIKVPYEQLDSIAAYAADDVTPPDAGVEPVTVNDLTGEWEDGGLGFSNNFKLTFSGNQVTAEQDGNTVYQGDYTLNNNVVSFVINGTTYQSAAGLAGGKSVLIMKEVSEDGSENLAFILMKKGKTINTKKEDIQGQWCWWFKYSDDDQAVVRVAYKFEGDNFEVIICPWGQRYTGTYTYEGGIVQLNTTAGYTSREEGTGNGSMEGDLDPVTLEAPWRVLYEENWHAPDGGLFFVVGNEAYSFILMPCICTKRVAQTR